TVHSDTERKTLTPLEFSFPAGFPQLKGGKILDTCLAKSGFDGQTKADPDKSYQENRFIYRQSGNQESKLRSVITHDYRFQVLTVGKSADLTARMIIPGPSDVITLDKDIKWHSQEITSADFKKLGEDT